MKKLIFLLIFLIMIHSSLSTELILQDADTENLDDGELEVGDGDAERGATAEVFLGSGEQLSFKFNLSSIPYGSTIDNAELYIWGDDGLLDSGETWNYSIYHIFGDGIYNWTEGDCDGSSFSCTSACTGIEWCQDNQPVSNEWNETFLDSAFHADGDGKKVHKWNVTKAVANDVANSNNNVSFWIKAVISTGSPSSNDPGTIYMKEWATVSERPLLNITYSEGGPAFLDKWVFNFTDTQQIGIYNMTNVYANTTIGASNFTSPDLNFIIAAVVSEGAAVTTILTHNLRRRT